MALISPTADLQAYRSMVLNAMEESTRTGKAVVFGNTGSAHAAIVLEVMIANAVNSIDIVSGFLDKTVWNSKSLLNLLSRNHKVKCRILLDELSDNRVPEGSALDTVQQGPQIEVKRLATPLGLHLCSIDSKHVRLESLQRTHEASVTFGDSVELGPTIERVFGNLWNKLHNQPALAYGPMTLVPA